MKKSYQLLVVGLLGLSFLTACNNATVIPGIFSINSRYNEEQPSLSGNGRYLAFVSSRSGKSNIYLYDLQQNRLLDLPGLNLTNAIASNPSLSVSARYLVYISSINGKSEIALYDRAIRRGQILTQAYRSWVRNPQISPDGRYIVFETARRGQWDIEVLDRGTNIELDITDGTRVTSEVKPDR